MTDTNLTNRLKESKCVIIINPTKYLGNFLISGGIIQDFIKYCNNFGILVALVLDEKFRGFSENSFPGADLIFFNRSSKKYLKKLTHTIKVIKSIRYYKADIAFNIEEDSITNHLTRLSSAKFKVGCSKNRHNRGYDQVLDINYINREKGKEHRWYSYYEVFSKFGMKQNEKSYISLNTKTAFNNNEISKLYSTANPIIIIHACATKKYKIWDYNNYYKLSINLSNKGYQVIFIGAGTTDKKCVKNIFLKINSTDINLRPINLINKLSLIELHSLLKISSGIIGNDSGPIHLASSLNIPTCVLFGPTNSNIWGPVGNNSKVILGHKKCSPSCNKSYCENNYRCLQSIHPGKVENELYDLIESVKM